MHFKKISSEAVEALTIHSWPGNIRELENLLERLVVTCSEDVIEFDSLLNYIDVNHKDMISSVVKRNGSFTERIEAVEKQMLMEAVSKCKNTREIAKLLDISQPTVVRKMKRYCIKISR